MREAFFTFLSIAVLENEPVLVLAVVRIWSANKGFILRDLSVNP